MKKLSYGKMKERVEKARWKEKCKEYEEKRTKEE